MQYSIVNISCGLGNQLFQYAFGYAMSKRNNSKLILYKYEDQPERRPYQLDKYDIIKDRVINYDHRSFRDRCFIKISEKIEEVEFTYNENILYQSSKTTFYNGYWQNWRYFDEYYEDLIKIFQYKHDFSKVAKNYIRNIDSKDNSVSIHIRRGDYENIKLTLDIGYYCKAINYLKKKIGENISIFIFTDDKEFVKNNMRFTEGISTLIEGEMSDIEEFEIMRKCKHHVIANSTFSWWAAYLGIDKNGIVIAPKIYHWTEEFYLPNWECIEGKFDRS